MPERDEDRVAAVRRALGALLDRLAQLVAEEPRQSTRDGDQAESPAERSQAEKPEAKSP